MDHLQKLQLQVWTDKQKDLEEKRRECLEQHGDYVPKVASRLVTFSGGQHGQPEQGQDGAMGLWGVPGAGEQMWKSENKLKPL